MPLSCDFDDYSEPGDVCWVYTTKWKQHNRRRIPKCCSCGDAVPRGKNCLEFRRYKVPESAIEIRIYGEDGEVPRASAFMCWECGWRYKALVGFKYAVNIYDDMRALMIEHDNLAEAGLEGCR